MKQEKDMEKYTNQEINTTQDKWMRQKKKTWKKKSQQTSI